MGSAMAYDLVETTDIDTALQIHLRANHYPPIGIEMIPVCKEAIQLSREGLHQSLVDLPTGVSYRNDITAPAWAIVDAHHLHAWVDQEEGED